jgi:hypothetical protein
MSSLPIKGTVHNGQAELSAPLDWPEGTAVLVSPCNVGVEDRGAMSAEEITQVLAAMHQMEPFEMTPAEERQVEAGRQRSKAYTIANMHHGVEELFP